MKTDLQGQAALFTGAFLPVTLTVARRLWQEGVRIAFAGPNVRSSDVLYSLSRQMHGDVSFISSNMSSPEEAQEAAGLAAECFGRVDYLFHTVGSDTDSLSSNPYGAFYVDNGATLTSAVISSCGTLAQMVAQRHGHILHLVTRTDVGAQEVESLALDRLRQSWTLAGAPAGIRLSAVYFDEPKLLAPVQREPGEARVLEMAIGRSMEEDDWAEKVMQAGAIGDLIVQVCSGTGAQPPDSFYSFEFPALAH